MRNLPQTSEVTVPTGADEIRKLLKRAQGGDASTLPALRKMLENPATVDLLGGDLARQAELRASRGTLAAPGRLRREEGRCGRRGGAEASR